MCRPWLDAERLQQQQPSLPHSRAHRCLESRGSRLLHLLPLSQQPQQQLVLVVVVVVVVVSPPPLHLLLLPLAQPLRGLPVAANYRREGSASWPSQQHDYHD